MIGRFCALKAARISPATTARLIAPTTTGLRSLNGMLIACHPSAHLSEPVLYCTGTVTPATVTLPWNWQR